MSKKELSNGQNFAFALTREMQDRLKNEAMSQPDGERTFFYLDALRTLFQNYSVQMSRTFSKQVAVTECQETVESLDPEPMSEEEKRKLT